VARRYRSRIHIEASDSESERHPTCGRDLFPTVVSFGDRLFRGFDPCEGGRDRRLPVRWTETRLPSSPDNLLKFLSRRDRGLPLKDLLQQHPMRFLVAIRAAIADDQQSVVRVGGMA
jgi:hypothetical protein